MSKFAAACNGDFLVPAVGQIGKLGQMSWHAHIENPTVRERPSGYHGIWEIQRLQYICRRLWFIAARSCCTIYWVYDSELKNFSGYLISSLVQFILDTSYLERSV